MIKILKTSTATHRTKTILGVGLVILAIAAMFFWEAEGRERLLMDPVLAAERDINAGETISLDMFREISAPVGTLVENAVRPEDAALLTGKEAAIDIIKGSQLSSSHLRIKDSVPKPETSFFTIRNEWIYMCTSSLRRGDHALITSTDGKTIIGRYAIAYVKDSDGREVTNSSSSLYSFTDPGGESERIHTSAPIHHIEIECELNDYRRLLDFCAGKAGASLMLIREID